MDYAWYLPTRKPNLLPLKILNEPRVYVSIAPDIALRKMGSVAAAECLPDSNEFEEALDYQAKTKLQSPA